MEQFKMLPEGEEENLTETTTLDFNERRKECDRLIGELSVGAEVLEKSITAVLNSLGSSQELGERYSTIMRLGEPFRAIAVAKQMLLQARLEETFRDFMLRRANSFGKNDWSRFSMMFPGESLNKILADYDVPFADMGNARYEAISALKSENSNLISKLEEYKKVSF